MATAGVSGVLAVIAVVLSGLSGWLWRRLRSATRAAKEAEAKMAALRQRIGKYKKHSLLSKEKIILSHLNKAFKEIYFL